LRLEDVVNFDENGLIPAIISDSDRNKTLTLCYMNREALRLTLETKLVHVFRRSKNTVMLKGETSHHTQEVKELLVDCEGNSLLIKVKQSVAACHAGYFTCYYRRLDLGSGDLQVVEEKIFDPEAVYRPEK
jgi:phosphoribosyl-AMP cyclohydrolase